MVKIESSRSVLFDSLISVIWVSQPDQKIVLFSYVHTCQLLKIFMGEILRGMFFF